MRYAVDVWELPLVLPIFAKAEAEEPAAKIRAIDDETLTAIMEGMREDYRDVFQWLLLWRRSGWERNRHRRWSMAAATG
ncbi:MAG: hypothetical protein AcusKO_25140 [Acuticoccus sp.]